MSLKHIFPFDSDEQLALRQVKATRNPNFRNLCVTPTQECDVICPVDETTGHRTSRLTKVMDPTISPLEKERLMSTLQRMSTPTRTRLSDQDLMALTPSRYNTAMVDDEKFADYLHQVVDEAGITDVGTSADSTSDSTADPTN